MRRNLRIAACVAASALALWILSGIAPDGYTRVGLTEDGKGGEILSAVVPDGERVTLTWRHSQFGLHVTEVFLARSGVLVQDQVTFSAMGGRPAPRVTPRDVDDLYHTGGAFDARGLSRPFRRIVYRVGEIGEPKIHVQDRTVAFGNVAGFGGRLILVASRPAIREILWSRVFRVGQVPPLLPAASRRPCRPCRVAPGSYRADRIPVRVPAASGGRGQAASLAKSGRRDFPARQVLSQPARFVTAGKGRDGAAPLPRRPLMPTSCGTPGSAPA